MNFSAGGSKASIDGVDSSGDGERFPGGGTHVRGGGVIGWTGGMNLWAGGVNQAGDGGSLVGGGKNLAGSTGILPDGWDFFRLGGTLTRLALMGATWQGRATVRGLEDGDLAEEFARFLVFPGFGGDLGLEAVDFLGEASEFRLVVSRLLDQFLEAFDGRRSVRRVFGRNH